MTSIFIYIGSVNDPQVNVSSYETLHIPQKHVHFNIHIANHHWLYSSLNLTHPF